MNRLFTVESFQCLSSWEEWFFEGTPGLAHCSIIAFQLFEVAKFHLNANKSQNLCNINRLSSCFSCTLMSVTLLLFYPFVIMIPHGQTKCLFNLHWTFAWVFLWIKIETVQIRYQITSTDIISKYTDKDTLTQTITKCNFFSSIQLNDVHSFCNLISRKKRDKQWDYKKELSNYLTQNWNNSRQAIKFWDRVAAKESKSVADSLV